MNTVNTHIPQTTSFVGSNHTGTSSITGLPVISSTIITKDGYAVTTVTEVSPDNTAHIRSHYYWSWPSVVGLKVMWNHGDSVRGADGVDWIRYDRNPICTVDANARISLLARLNIVHNDAVGHITALNEAGHVDNPKFMGQDIPPLWNNAAEGVLHTLGYSLVSPNEQTLISVE